jgi:nicotinate-nucleotide pyrophosphorylase (carboxylating)
LRAAVPPPLASFLVEPVIRAALAEDLGRAGDLTTELTVPADARARASIRARRHGRIAGLDAALLSFRLLDPELRLEVVLPDGADVGPGDTVAVVEGRARPILTGERTALNLLTRLSGIATATREAVRAVAGTRARVACTRKTTPGLRALEKYAVRVGGGTNHRFGLDDGVLIKDNHIAAAGGILEAIDRARAGIGHMTKLEVEVDTLDQLRLALTRRVDAVLLDNMAPPTLREAMAMVAGRALTEASGGITPANLPEIAAAGVDIVSLGWLTHSAPGLDLGLDLEPA